MTDQPWPTAKLDPIRRARILASAIPGGYSEVVLAVPYDRVWAWLSDLERSVPAFDHMVDTLEITRRQAASDGAGEDIQLIATRHHVPLPFTVRLEDGWCLMRARARAFLVVMAAAADGPDRTRYAQLEAVPLPGGRFLQRRLTREVNRDIQGIRRILTS